MIRVLLAEDQGTVRDALTILLGLQPDIEVVASVARGDEVVTVAEDTNPDVLLLDIEMPGLSGLDATAQVHRLLPDCRIVILTTFGRPGYLRRAMEGGAVGFLVKEAPVAQLANSIRRAMAGERVLDPELAAAALSEGESPLTEREREVLAATNEGQSVAEIADALFLSQRTVRNYLSEAIQKMDARNRVEAAHRARLHGWL